MIRISASILAFVMFAALISLSAAAQSVTEVQLSQDQVVYEFVGQFNNNGAASQQFGYLSKITGMDGIFSGEPEKETTALFTSVTNANGSSHREWSVQNPKPHRHHHHLLEHAALGFQQPCHLTARGRRSRSRTTANR